MPFDYKKEYKEFYLPKAVPQLVTLPPLSGLPQKSPLTKRAGGGIVRLSGAFR